MLLLIIILAKAYNRILNLCVCKFLWEVFSYGYDVIDNDGLVEKLARDTEGYIHLGYVRVSESAQIKVTVFDKAKADNVEYTGNKTTGVWTSRIDRIAPTVNVKVVAIPASEHGLADNNKVVLGLKADISLPYFPILYFPLGAFRFGM